MIILGIDTSCDDTSVALVEDGRSIKANVVRSQLRMHEPHGGVVPEVASRAHLGDIAGATREALETADLAWEGVDAIGVTQGPGLSGSLRVGLSFAKGLALARGLPLVAVNHLEGHIYSNWLIADHTHPQPEPRFPVLVLIVSGGHTELVLMSEHCQYRLLGSTRDDAAGEAFDKVGRQLGLGFPGGPAIQRAAAEHAASEGAEAPAALPRAWLRGSADFSFSGLKTAVWHRLQVTAQGEAGAADPAARNALAFAFQDSVVDVLVTKTLAAAQDHDEATVCVCGGVASNQSLRERMRAACTVPVYVPPPSLCVDNGAMIAAAAYFRLKHGGEAAGDPLAADALSGLALPLS